MKKFLKMVLAVICGILLLNLLTIAIFAGLATPGKPTVPPQGGLKIDMSRIVISEQTQDPDPMTLIQSGGQEISQIGIWDAVCALRKAADDPGIKYIYLKTDGNTTAVSALSELRKALENFRTSSGKPVVTYLESLGAGAYYLASVSDKIYMTNSVGGNPSLTGIGTQMVFFGDLLKKLGVNVQLIRHGKYKSAGETFTRSDASPENREQYQRMIDSLWETIGTEIAEARGIDPARLDELIDGLKLRLPQDCLDNGLVDGLLGPGELEEKLAVLAVKYNFKDVKFINFPDYVTSRVQSGKARQKIAVIYADGEIIDGSSKSNVAGDRFAAVVAKVRADSTVKAVVLRVNSPGGSVLASEKIKAQLDLLGAEKPLVASYGNYAASGGYWISNNCEKIYSDATTLTGSIGVFGLVPDFSKTASDVLHVGVESVSSNKHGDMFGAMRPFDKAEYDYMLRSIEDIYDRFTTIVSEGRDIPKQRVDEIGQGRVWTGRDALELGLVDEIGTLEDAVAYAALLAGNEDMSAWSVKGYPTPPNAMESIMASISGPKEDYAVRLRKEIEQTGIFARLPYEFKIIF